MRSDFSQIAFDLVYANMSISVIRMQVITYWKYDGPKICSFAEGSNELSYQNLSFVRRRCLHGRCFHISIFFFRTTGSISTKIGTKHHWVKGIQVCSNKKPFNSHKENNEFFQHCDNHMTVFIDFQEVFSGEGCGQWPSCFNINCLTERCSCKITKLDCLTRLL